MAGRKTVAVPSDHPGGLGAARSSHVGRARAFTLVDVAADGSLGNVRVLANPADDTSPHGVVAAMLVGEAVTDLVVEGIGEGMRTRLAPAGVRIWRDSASTTVEAAVRSLAANMLSPITDADVHPGGHPGHAGHHGGSPTILN